MMCCFFKKKQKEKVIEKPANALAVSPRIEDFDSYRKEIDELEKEPPWPR